MATASQVDMIHRLCRTHLIREEPVEAAVGPIENLSEDQAKRLICALADGEFGGLSHPSRDDGRVTDQQQWALYTRAQGVLDYPLREGILAFGKQHYPGIEWISDLTCRQAARLIVELDLVSAKDAKEEP